MKIIKFQELQDELIRKGIPEFCKQLKIASNYDAIARKIRLNPEEAELLGMIKKTTAEQENESIIVVD